MRYIWNILRAEVVKQHRLYLKGYGQYFSLFIWPVLGFVTVYFTYRPFSFEEANIIGITTSNELMMFLSTGFMAATCFQVTLSAAQNLNWMERQGGTLELMFLTPANRLVMLYGKSLGALLQNTWLCICFSVIILVYSGGLGTLPYIPLIYILLIITSTVWGGLLNAYSLFSRDTLAFVLLDEPMRLFSGARVPLQSFPVWGQAISMIFPITYSLRIVRLVFAQAAFSEFVLDIVLLMPLLIVLVVITFIAIKRVERNNRRTGQLNLF